MSKVVYNGYEFSYVLSEFSEVPQMDPSGSDHVYDLLTLRVTAILAPGLVPALPGETAAQTCDRIKGELSLPRRPLLYEREGGVKLIDLPNGRDEENGPKPFGVTVALGAEGSFVVNWGVEVRLNLCGKRSKNFIPLVLSNRWRESVTINDRWLTVKKRQGRLVLSGRAGINPDDYRKLCTPEVDAGFVRTNAEYVLQENGLEVMYQFTDEQQVMMPPFPAIQASGRQIESAALPGAVRYGQLELRLTGPPGVKKEDLLKAAVRIGMSRALAGGLKKQGPSYLIGGMIAEDLFENSIELHMRWQCQPGEGRTERKPGVFGAIGQGLIGAVLQNLPPAVGDALAGGALPELLQDQAQNQRQALPIGPGVPGGVIENDIKPEQHGLTVPVAGWLGKDLPGVVKERGVAPPTRGTVEALRLYSALLRDPCLTETLRPQPDPKNEAAGVVKKAKVFQVPKLPEQEPGEALYEDGDSPGAYEHYSIVMHYTQNEGKELLISTGKHEGTDKMKPHPVVNLQNETLELMVELTAKRTGGPPVLPDPKKVPKVTAPDGTQIDDPVYLGGTISPANIDLAADGVTTVHTVSAVFRYKYRLPCEADVTSPLPPFLKLDLKREARLAASVASGNILFLSGPRAGGDKNVNLFCGKNVKELGVAELVGYPGRANPS